MKAPSTPDTASESRAVANEPSKDSVAVPAVPLALDMNDDGIEEPHELFIDTRDGGLWLHSDKQTLETFIERKRNKNKGQSPQIDDLLTKIKEAAAIVHRNTYTRTEPAPRRESKKTKNKFRDTKTIRPNDADRDEAIKQLMIIAGYLKELNKLSEDIMKKMRPPSHKSVLETEKVQGTDFCKRIVMEPLSLLPRDDNIRGTPPCEASALYSKLTTRISYIRGHMLNEHLHGPGTNNNIVPISSAFNSKMKVTVEQATKDAVNANNKVVRFEAEAKDWGSYGGFYNGGFPDEKLLPAKFKFDVRQMKLKTDRDGSSINDWYVTGVVIYSQELKHEPPSAADVKKGTLAPVERTFEPGYYISVKDKYKQIAADTYHLNDTYVVNGPSYSWLFKPLGLDPAALRSDRLELLVTTVFKVPAGYELVPVPEEEIEIIHNKATMKKHTPGGSSFLIVKRAEWMKSLEIFREELRRVKAEALRQKEDPQKTTGSATRVVIAGAADPRRVENEQQQLKLEANIRIGAQKLRSPLDNESKKKFDAIFEELIEQAKSEWKKNEQLGSRNAEELQKHYLATLAQQRDLMLQAQMQGRAPVKTEVFIPALIETLQNRIGRMSDGFRDPVELEIFRAEAEKILAFYRGYWTDPKQRFHIGQRDALLHSAYKKLDAVLRQAQGATASTQAPQLPKRKREDTIVNKRNTEEEEEEEEAEDPREKERDQKRLRPTPSPFRLPSDSAGPAPWQQDTPRFQLPAPTHGSRPVHDNRGNDLYQS